MARMANEVLLVSRYHPSAVQAVALPHTHTHTYTPTYKTLIHTNTHFRIYNVTMEIMKLILKANLAISWVAVKEVTRRCIPLARMANEVVGSRYHLSAVQADALPECSGWNILIKTQTALVNRKLPADRFVK